VRDTNNPLSQAVHEYYQLVGNDKSNDAYRFIVKWMQNEEGLEVGENFIIVPCAGEAYEVNIESHGTIIPLADKGMGSIQAMLLLFRLGIVVHKTEMRKVKPLVIIEEPELNLHPGLQSKLCDVFLEVHEKHNVDLLVETHSEYIIRRSQVIVAKKEYASSLGDNPFSVIYFPKEIDVERYSMTYQADGTFEKDFGRGFFDEASNSTLELLRINRKSKND
jgi:hypothetical protein